MCREEALDVTSLLNEKDSFSNLKLLATIKEIAPTKQCDDDACLGVSDFAKKYFPSGEVYLNEENIFWKVLGSRRITSQRPASYNPIKIYKGIKEIGKRQSAKVRNSEGRLWKLRRKNFRLTTSNVSSDEQGVEGNLKGEGIVQGGIIIFGPSGNVEYVYQEKTGYEIPRDDIISVLDRIVGE